MDELDKDSELERMLRRMNQELPPENIMRDYAAGVHLKIEAKQRFFSFAIPITIVVFSISAVILISLAVLWHQNCGGGMWHTSPAKFALSSPVTPEQKTSIAKQAGAVSVTEINREIKILQALGEDPAGVITETMDINQLAKELAYWDEVAMQSYKQMPS